jgi:hypothetical protein
VAAESSAARAQWTELNIGPYRVDTEGDEGKARQTLANLEQLRWILGGMLETKTLTAIWPFRILITASAPARSPEIVLAHGEYIVAVRPDSSLPYPEIARLFLTADTNHLPKPVESGLPELFNGLRARGSLVTWAAPPEKPDLDWARAQYFATKPEYAGRFQVFINNLRGGSLLSVAEANAFGKDSKTLEKEVSEYFASGAAQAVTISGRALDPKRDFGEHSLDPSLADLYLADTIAKSNPGLAEPKYKQAANDGYEALAEEGLAFLISSEGGDPREHLDRAIAAQSKSAWVYEKSAQDRPPVEAMKLLETARSLNPRWYKPVLELAELTQSPPEKEKLLKSACELNPRSSELWVQLAELQSKSGKSMAAQNSWIRAEDAASTEEERNKIHAKRLAQEEARLDAGEAARREADRAAKAEDERLRNNQLERIRAAEQKANESTGSGSGELKEVVPWWNEGETPAHGELAKVDCMESQAVLWLTSSGKKLKLLVPDPSKIRMDGGKGELPCGTQQPARQVSVTYRPRLDKHLGTAGDVVSLHFE